MWEKLIGFAASVSINWSELRSAARLLINLLCNKQIIMINKKYGRSQTHNLPSSESVYMYFIDHQQKQRKKSMLFNLINNQHTYSNLDIICFIL